MAEARGSKITDHLRIRFFDGLPSPLLFQSQIETLNVPAVFRGAVKDWKAVQMWDPRKGGLDYLKEKLGSVVVEVMLSNSGPVFYGDLRSHERVPIPFSTFITSCKVCLNADRRCTSDDDAQITTEIAAVDHDKECSSVEDTTLLGHLYLAQVPILNTEYDDMSTLGNLQDDIHIPAVLESKQLVSINFWMNSSQSRSSTHYDPHQNLLCVVAGCKQVNLWPPSATPSLYPMPVYGEASNHSAVDIINPDLLLHRRFKNSSDYHQKVILDAGDALFLPEGWFHQVDSTDLTVAVNFWWKSHMMLNMLEHMDSYYLRRIVNRLVGKEMDLMLHWPSNNDLSEVETFNLHESDGTSVPNFGDVREPEENPLEGAHGLDDLEPSSIQALHELVSIVHDFVNSAPISALATPASPSTELKGGKEGTSTAKSFGLKEDRVASLLWSLKPLVLRKILLSLAEVFPRTLEALILHALSPTAAEVLTRKFDQMDHLSSRKQRNEFYQVFYSVFQDQFAAMDSLLAGKESFAFQALKDVMDQYLDVKLVKQSKP